MFIRRQCHRATFAYTAACLRGVCF